MKTSTATWQRRLGELARAHGVPGASLAVLANGEVTTAATGVLNLETGVETTVDSVFQVGSITKVYTTTLMMQLADEGRLRLDQPVVELLPDLDLGDAEATRRVTVRHLLTHTSGLQGDHFLDTGRGDDAVDRYVASCRELGFVHPVGATFSYCNSGFVVAGRVIEVLTGRVWDDAFRERLLEPMGAARSVTLPEDALRFRAACGHVADPGEEPHLAPRWMLPRSVGPAGLLCATASDVIAFARMHLEDGHAADGRHVLSAAGVAAMQERQVELPDRWTLGQAWGLGWILFDWDGRRVIGHDGGTIGQAASLRVVPDAGVAVALLTNGGHTRDLSHHLLREILADVAGLDVPRPLAPPATPVQVDVSPYAGRYERLSLRVELEPAGSVLRGRITSAGPLAALTKDPTREVELVPVADRLFVTRPGDDETWAPVVFYEVAGRRYLHTGGRAAPESGALVHPLPDP
jgi:CubicO group peptidase (beta-lactamase class C family)